MVLILKQSGVRLVLAIGLSIFVTSCSSTDLASQKSFSSKESFALATARNNASKIAKQDTQANKKPDATAEKKAAKSGGNLKSKIAAAKKQVDGDQKRLADYDKMLKPLTDDQKKYFKAQRDPLVAKLDKSTAELNKLEAAAAPKAASVSGGVRGRGQYHALIAKHARANGVPLGLAHAVVRVESSYRANARGRAGEIGLMQLKPSTARLMGYRGSAKGLYNPDTNLRYGMAYLGKAHRLAGGSTCGTILRYNAGHGATRMNPVSKRYCNRVARYI